jgi:CRP-like cAMP-binding protein/uncharacterized protein (DUF2249 family)
VKQGGRAELDVRSWTTAQRYERVLAAFEALGQGEQVRIIVDHEPRALRLHLSEVRAGHYVWTQRNLGEDYWEATIKRVAPLSDVAHPYEALLHRTSLFTDLRLPARKALAQAAVQRHFVAQTTIVEQGTAWPFIGLVVSGSVTSMVGTDAGRDYCLFEAFPFDIFGEIQVLDTGGTIARYEAGREETTILLLPRNVVLDLADNDGRLSRRFAEVCAQRARLLHEMLYARMTKPTINRLAAAILPYATRTEGFAKALQPLPSMTQGQLASLAGTVKDVVGRDLAALQAAGAVDLSGGRITRIDEARLRSFL